MKHACGRDAHIYHLGEFQGFIYIWVVNPQIFGWHNFVILRLSANYGHTVKPVNFLYFQPLKHWSGVPALPSGVGQLLVDTCVSIAIHVIVTPVIDTPVIVIAIPVIVTHVILIPLGWHNFVGVLRLSAYYGHTVKNMNSN